MKVWFERREELAPGIWEYYFRPERPVDFTPGQYVNFQIPQPLADPRGQGRVFTLTSLPDDPLVSFVAKLPTPHSPYKEALHNLAVGDELRLDDAMGDLVLPKSPAVPLVFVAGGIGMASFASMLKQLLKTREERSIFLFYGVRSRNERIFQDLAHSYPLTLNTTAIAPHRLTAQEIKDSTPPDSQVYLSGSERFVEGLRGDLERLGTPHEQIVFDYFDGYVEL
jgi:ferredoxin-NADP reductase